METSKKILRVISIIYLVAAVVMIAAGICAFVMPDKFEEMANKSYKDVDLGELKPTVMLGVTYIISGLGKLWFSWLFARIVKGKSEGMLVLVLLILGIIGTGISLFKGFAVTSLVTIAVDVFTVIIIMKIRNEALE